MKWNDKKMTNEKKQILLFQHFIMWLFFFFLIYDTQRSYRKFTVVNYGSVLIILPFITHFFSFPITLLCVSGVQGEGFVKDI